MKYPTTTLLAYLFPLLAPTLVFAHARPHPHPHGVAENEIDQVPRLKRQVQVNETVTDTTSSSSTTVSSTSASTTTTTSRSGINLDDILSEIESGVLGETSTTSTSQEASTTSGGSRNATDGDSSSTTDSSSDVPQTSITSGLTTGLNTPSITIQPPIPVDTSSPTSDDSSSSSRTQIPIIGTLSDILTSLLDPEEPTSTTSSDTATITSAPTTTTASGLDDILSSILDDASSVISSVVSDITTSAPNATDATTVLPDPTTLIPTETTTVLPTDTDVSPTDVPTGLPTDLPTNSTIEPTLEPTDPVTLPTETSTDILPTETGTDIPTSTLPSANTTAPGPTELPGTTILTETSDTSETTVPTETTGLPSLTLTEEPITTSTDVPSSDEETSAPWFGTSLVTASQPAPTDPDAPAPTETALPSGVPEAITPPGGVPTEPDNSTLVQIGFNRQYNYGFVSTSLESAAQICDFLPKGLADGLEIDLSELRMHTLQPLQAQGLDYIITVALIYIPSLSFPKLEADLHVPLSGIYENKAATIKDFMKTIDPTIPLRPGGNIALLPKKQGGDNPNDPDWVLEADDLVDGSESTGTSSGNPEQGADPYNADGESNTVTSKTVVVGVASVGAAALYGVAMYFLAKRYRNNRLSHRRSQSLSGGGIEPPMSDIRSSGALSPMMSTHFFNNGRMTPTGSDKRGSKGSKTSARGQISAPMMSENSLGWD